MKLVCETEETSLTFNNISKIETNANRRSILLKSPLSRKKVFNEQLNDYKSQQWFQQIKAIDKEIINQSRVLPRLNLSIAMHSQEEISNALK